MKLFGEPHFLLVDKFVLFGAKARQTDAIAITSLGYDCKNVNFWFQILFHNRNLFIGYSAGAGATGTV
jgi:hypothetical protein